MRSCFVFPAAFIIFAENKDNEGSACWRDSFLIDCLLCQKYT